MTSQGEKTGGTHRNEWSYVYESRPVEKRFRSSVPHLAHDESTEYPESVQNRIRQWETVQTKHMSLRIVVSCVSFDGARLGG